jgi:hypothetical protein
LAYIASGNIVALGWMKPRAVKDKRGRMAVWRMLPAHVRIGAWTELAQYCHPKRKAIEGPAAGGNSLQANVTFVMPSNGREPAPAPADSSQEGG